MSEAAELNLIDQTLRFNTMPASARAWLVSLKAELLRRIAANDNKTNHQEA